MIFDTNAILRFLLNDIPQQTEKVEDIILYNKVFIPNEVIAEVVFVLRRVYEINRNDISDIIIEFVEYRNIIIPHKEFIIYSLNKFKNSNLGFIDCLLCAYKKFKFYEVFTFDKKLNKHLSKI